MTRSIASLVSVHGDEFLDTSKTSTEVAVSGSCGNAETRDLSSSATQKFKSEALLTEFQFDQTVQIVVKRDKSHQAVVWNNNK